LGVRPNAVLRGAKKKKKKETKKDEKNKKGGKKEDEVCILRVCGNGEERTCLG